MDPYYAPMMVAALVGPTGRRPDSFAASSAVWHPQAFTHDADGRRYPPPFRLRRRPSIPTDS